MTEKTATEIAMSLAPTRLDALVTEIMRACDHHTRYAVSYDRHGNKWGDEDGMNAARARLEETIRAGVVKLLTPPL